MRHPLLASVLGLALFAPALVGCDKKVAEEKSVSTNPDTGKQTTNEKTTVKTPDGGTKTTEEHKVTTAPTTP